ncbi:GNAT family N-acetyltransferase [Microvirga sp. 3-52]|nr:GNAT family N-acetyltransferase [Microvirga sp. 3-52]
MPLPAGVTSHPALTFTTNALAETMTAAFEGYVVPQSVTAETFNARFRREHLDLSASRVLTEGERPIAIVLVARRGWTARIAAMGIIPEYRGRGLGALALGEVLADLRQTGDRRLVLEVIDTNEPAVRLYHHLGFRKRRRLVGYRRSAGADVALAALDLVDVDPLMVARRVAGDGVSDLPWIMAPETLAAAAAPARGIALAGEAFAIVEPAPQPQDLVLRTLVVAQHARDRGLGRRMITALAAAYPGQDLVLSANTPEDLVPGFLTRMGFERTPISQFEMLIDLGP